ncbi:MAG TPA: hypothetical protein VFU46_06730 [Gemmatimonadales bacterium]|nr:hypothetical protein [Gemmatimonadales bacterium]
MPPVIASGTAFAIHAFELGHSIDLDRCERIVAESARQTIRPSRRLPEHFAYRPAPLRLVQEGGGLAVGRLRCAAVHVVLYDFGAASVAYELPLAGCPLEELADLSDRLCGGAGLVADARGRLEALLAVIGPAVTRPRLAEPVEDYLVFEVARFDPPVEPARLLSDAGPTLARLLRGETGSLAPEEVEDALGARLRVGPGDLAVVDWNAAFVCHPAADEARVVLDFANVQLLELRWLDAELDAALEQAYDALARVARGGLAELAFPAADLRHVGELQADAAVLFERVTNALKLVGDQYLSRLYRLVSGRLHLADWDAGIFRKLQTLDGIYQKLADRSAARRLEAIEWIVVLLIAFEIVLTLVGR